MAENRSAPLFPAWEANITDADYFGKDPDYVTVTARTRVPKADIDSGEVTWASIMESLAREAAQHGRS